jgi:DTW domain-containing protein
VLLDGTWKQARKMFKTSRWLHRFPLMTLVDPQQGCYAVRQAPVAGQLSTAEATVAVLQQCGRTEAAQLLGDYFGVFNQHYVAARMSTPAGRSVHHQRIEDLQQSRLPR